jgi:hypothetical protein
MIQLIINNEIEKISEDYKKEFLSKCETDIRKNLNALIGKLDPTDTEYAIKKDYIEAILSKLEAIIILKPNEMKSELLNFNLPSNDTNFYKGIVDALLYKKVRKEYFIKSLKNLEINCCVYCHTQGTNIVNEYYKINHKPHKKGDLKSQKAFFELDHYHPKSKYPFLCVSFYNLIPICSSCNKAKKDKNIDFDFYIESKSLIQDFKFNLSKGCVAKYIATKNKNDIIIEVSHPNKKILKNFDEVFSLNLKYNEYKDIVEELIYKEIKFNQIYLDSILGILNNTSLNKNIVKRITFGNYTEKDEALKRPLAKFYQDITEDIKSLKLKQK